MRYRVKKRTSCRFGEVWSAGWVVQMWDDGTWNDVTRVYEREERALRVKEMMEE